MTGQPRRIAQTRMRRTHSAGSSGSLPISLVKECLLPVDTDDWGSASDDYIGQTFELLEMESILSLSAIASGIAPRMVAVGTPVALEIGQLLIAIVLEPAKAGKTKLPFQGTRVAATSAAPLQPGDQLSLRVARLAPVIHLKIVPDTTNPNLVRQQALLKVLPRQLPVVEVMNNLVTNVLPPVNKTPPGLQAAARTLLENAPRIENLTQPNTIHQTLLRSGHFFESRLARAVIAPGTATGWLNTDLKALFVRCALPWRYPRLSPPRLDARVASPPAILLQWAPTPVTLLPRPPR